MRPKIEYASAIWNPHKNCLIDHIEVVRNHFASSITSSYSGTSSVALIKQSLNLPTLLSLERKKQMHSSAPFTKCIIASVRSHTRCFMPPHRTSRRLTNTRTRPIPGNTLGFNRSALLSGIRYWNDLPNSIVGVADTKLFRNKLQNILLNMLVNHPSSDV